jgi:hypothetical protein
MAAPAQVNLQIVTTSQVMSYNNLPAAAPPKITMNGVAFPSPASPPYMPTGYQLVIINAAMDYTNPASILANQYIACSPSQNNSWWNNYQYMYSTMVWNVLNAGNIDQQMLIIASFGLDNNMPPTNDGYEMMLGVGAGSQLQNWQTHCDPGSQVDNPTSWVSFPANYILVGFSAQSYGQGYEIYQNNFQNPVSTTLSVTLSNPPGN